MRRSVIVALALPVVALAAMIGQQEWLRSRVTVLNVPVRGVDPRDLLRGHYLTAGFEWNWERLPQAEADGRMPAGALCVIAIDAKRRPRVRFLPDSTADQATAGDCLLVVPGGTVGKRRVRAGHDRHHQRQHPAVRAGNARQANSNS